MRIRVYVVELSPRAKAKVVVALALALLAVTTLEADANVPNTFKSGDVLSAALMNANFADIDARLNSVMTGRIVATINGHSYSVGNTTYCGATTTKYTGAGVGGYGGAKTACEAVAGPCNTGGVTSAHMCTAEELIRSVATGVNGGVFPGGWYASGVWISGVPQAATNNNYNQNDCGGVGVLAAQWTQTAPQGGNPGLVLGPIWGTEAWFDSCTVSHTILCCD